jgi:hypothetical protein
VVSLPRRRCYASVAVCVQPVVTSWSRRTEDLTCDKTDEKDAVLIARLTAQLRCYVPEPVDETWARLRHLGSRREQLITEAGSQVQRMRNLQQCAWPAALDTARQLFRSGTWIAALLVIAGRDGGDFTRTGRLGAARFEQRRSGIRQCARNSAGPPRTGKARAWPRSCVGFAPWGGPASWC